MEVADRLPVIEDLAADSGLSRSRFYEVFKDCSGVSPYQYHLQLRMSRAKELLRGSALSIKEIAAVLRFSSVYQFSRIFKKKMGVSPSQYRPHNARAAVDCQKDQRNTP
jgi:AraC-like DNA-binding protein